MIENDDNNKISSEPEASGDGRGGISTWREDEQEADEEGDAEDDDCGGGGVTTKAFPSGCRACTCAGELLPRRGTTTVTQDQAAHASSPSPRLPYSAKGSPSINPEPLDVVAARPGSTRGLQGNCALQQSGSEEDENEREEVG
ncbi:unnamed protein product [Prorocentrum cordatum]|uniref:Uncharacterized protein n=1 Tax=Prorocentrum cordatum TaxID=2364126 RepID=A0ABN9Y4R9_9DINO|nr:unnamed protein product [Polarella glacialis]